MPTRPTQPTTSPPTDDPDTRDARALGERIRAARHARGLTLVQLAELSSLSHPFLSQLERGQARPSMSSLQRIAHALGTSQVELLAVPDTSPPGDDDPRVLRATAGRTGGYGAAHARVLYDAAAPFQTLEVAGSNTDFGQAYVHVEHEWVYVVSGRVEVRLDGEVSLLAPGDSLACPSEVAHHWRSPDGRPYLLVVVKEHLRRS
ncbi:helix-turn-helix domain-containing protein [Nocardioides mangrovi]|uniref:XRE family transcriptional regulator n=1 Tax=Nocardioides mangrovi TaxID=2874580 RepID=A0ABS7UC80_9ACTN|nr:XRE family transcriptional regulator [Nocardioides mangrovi]MBZ5738449.1 XRE family transcriptional regulator [Nocardioides mangrovi]